ncbi:hypothetical protein GLAREA_09435 [Glarea lozoyensis ATCC 20868]|uniref:Uncharacterized protein n=1 Tax=Glarea lozoyensis (strain ATCC 20868 / MF5171) TaxID=1116229 RepID=S3CRN7_GLAL2|nr:uncharacterized protein GLAREA_09435 [Glarea lozoyensis ATCC 20868]EPE28315.1 hypothetical protein GLAREA_09435 [Glarea lozoyensis ATCC 20868]
MFHDIFLALDVISEGMEIVRPRSEPSFREIADILWPRVPLTDLCLGKVETHPSCPIRSATHNNVLQREEKIGIAVSVHDHWTTNDDTEYGDNGNTVKEPRLNGDLLSCETLHDSKDVRTCYSGLLPETNRYQLSDRPIHFTKPLSKTNLAQLPNYQQLASNVGAGHLEERWLEKPRDGRLEEVAETQSRDKLNTQEKIAKVIDGAFAIARTSKSGPNDSSQAQSTVRSFNSKRIFNRIAAKDWTWPKPELSLGYKCNPIAGTECWEAIGPATDLFTLIAGPIKNLLDARVDDLEAHEHVAGDVLTFSMYMVGKDASVARPMLLFVCKSLKVRKRAIKFLKESKILNPYPEIRVANCSSPPSVYGVGFLELLSGEELPSETTTVGKSGIGIRVTDDSQQNDAVLTIVAVVGSLSFLLFTLFFVLIFFRRRKRRHMADMAEVDRIGNTGRSSESFEYYSPAAIRGPRTENAHQFEVQQVSPLRSRTLEFCAIRPQMREPTHQSLDIEAIPARNCTIAVDSNAMQISGTVEHSKSSRTVLARSGTSVTCVSTGRHATIGGCVTCKGIMYAMTAAHLFESPHPSIGNSISQADGLEDDFEFDDDDDTVDSEDDSTKVEFDSRISVSSTPSQTRPAGNSISSFQTQEMKLRATVLVAQGRNNESKTSQVRLVSIISSAREDYWQESVAMGSFSPSIPDEEALSSAIPASHRQIQDHASSISSDLGLDWALIRLPFATGHTLSLSPLGIKQKVSKTLPIFISRGASRTYGFISQTPSMIKLSTGAKFQEVWSVYLDDDLQKGDSGCWVLDAVTGALYGHIVTGVPGGKFASSLPDIHQLSTLRITDLDKQSILSGFFHHRFSEHAAKSTKYEAYFSYFENQWRQAKQNDHPHYNTFNREVIFAVLRQLQNGYSKEDIKIMAPVTNYGETGNLYSHEQVDSIVDLVARLWLMINTETTFQGITSQTRITWSSGSVKDLLASHFQHEIILTDSVKLEKVFNARNIERMTDVKIQWTPNLLDHLRFNEDGKIPVLNIFYCVDFLDLQKDKSVSRLSLLKHTHARSPLFPPHLVNETLQTLSLLLPTHDRSTHTWFRTHTRQNPNLDINLPSIGHLTLQHRQIAHFRYWHDRLVVLKQYFDESQPRTVKQWWYDDRKRVQWFWVAMVLVGGTFLFGLVQCVEGGLQVWAAMGGGVRGRW